MGFDYRRFTQFGKAFKIEKYPIMPDEIREITSVSNVPEWCNILAQGGNMLGFRPATGWEGIIEFNADVIPDAVAGGRR